MVTVRESSTVHQLGTPSTGVHSNSQHITFEKVKSYFGHLLLMVLVMEVGMIVYHHLVSPALSGTSYAILTDKYPLLGYWTMVVFMMLPMIVSMLCLRSTWRHCEEMTIAMLAPLAVMTILVLCYVLPNHILYKVGDPVMILAMAAYMLFRPHKHAHRTQKETNNQH